VIVGYQPGGTIRDARVVLRPDELLPNSFNISETVVYRENPDDPKEWVLVKPKHTILPMDSPLLSSPEEVLPDIRDLGETVEEKPFEHVDIIRFNE
jgi:hypothetical protein